MKRISVRMSKEFMTEYKLNGSDNCSDRIRCAIESAFTYDDKTLIEKLGSEQLIELEKNIQNNFFNDDSFLKSIKINDEEYHHIKHLIEGINKNIKIDVSKVIRRLIMISVHHKKEIANLSKSIPYNTSILNLLGMKSWSNLQNNVLPNIVNTLGELNVIKYIETCGGGLALKPIRCCDNAKDIIWGINDISEEHVNLYKCVYEAPFILETICKDISSNLKTVNNKRNAVVSTKTEENKQKNKSREYNNIFKAAMTMLSYSNAKSSDISTQNSNPQIIPVQK